MNYIIQKLPLIFNKFREFFWTLSREIINKREDPKIYFRFESFLQRGFKYSLKKGSPTQKRFIHSQQGLLRLNKKILLLLTQYSGSKSRNKSNPLTSITWEILVSSPFQTYTTSVWSSINEFYSGIRETNFTF